MTPLNGMVRGLFATGPRGSSISNSRPGVSSAPHPPSWGLCAPLQDDPLQFRVARRSIGNSKTATGIAAPASKAGGWHADREFPT
jgi:hypothetical protein